MIHEATISHIIIDSKGNDKTIKEQFIVEDKDWFGEVEALLMEEFGDYTDLDIPSIKRSKIKEIVNQRTSDDEKIFLATLVDVFHNDDGSEKEMKYTIAFFSKNMASANVYINEYARQGYNMSITKIVESSFTDVLK